jgi:hypothetical protein
MIVDSMYKALVDNILTKLDKIKYNYGQCMDVRLRAIQCRHAMSGCKGLDPDLCSHIPSPGIGLYADMIQACRTVQACQRRYFNLQTD